MRIVDSRMREEPPREPIDPGVRRFLAVYAPTRDDTYLVRLLADPDRLLRESRRFEGD